MDKSIHTDQVGSLNRPAELLAARNEYKAGQITRAQLATIEDEAIAESLEAQKRIGTQILSDGEMRRDGWQSDLSESVDGFVADYPVTDTAMPDGSVQRLVHHGKAVEGQLHLHKHLLQDTLPIIKGHADRPFKVTMPSPCSASKASFQPGLTDTTYRTRNDLLEKLIEIYLGEIAYLQHEGVPYVQLDEGFAFYTHDGFEDRAKSQGWNAENQLETDIAAENRLWDALPDTTMKAIHICRGNRTRGGGTGKYDWLAEQLFAQLHVDRFLLEYDTERAGDFSPLRHLPKGKMVVLGIISSKFGELERQDELLARIEEAAKYCPLDQLALSAQCGFGGSDDKNHMTIDEQWRKFELVLSTAERVWH